MLAIELNEFLSKHAKLNKFVKSHLIYFKDASKDLLKLLANLDGKNYLCFDTESCKDIKSNEEIQYYIKSNKIVELEELKKLEKKIKERIWCWSLSNTLNDDVVFGYSLDDFFEFLNMLYDYKQFDFRKKSKRKNLNIKCFVHNLAWDIEFFKYYLNEKGYQYYSKILYDDDSVEDEILDCDCYNIVENNGQVYNSTINIKKNDIHLGKKHFKSFISLKFYDSLKLIPNSLDEIGRKIIKLDEMFYKLKDEFDYEYIRPYNYKLNTKEKCYIFNDVYILKEFIRQYYIKNNLNGYTASSIAFNNMLNYIFPDEKDKYKAFEKIYPPIKDIEVKKIIDSSYSGGFTYGNSNLLGLIINKEGHSIDINSSYPYAMKNKPLPYDLPKYQKGKIKLDEEYNIGIQRIVFDGFKRKNGSNIGFIQIGKCCNFNIDIKKAGLKKNQYMDSNFDSDENLMTFNYECCYTNFELDLLMQAYDFYVYKRDENGNIIKGKRNLKKGLIYKDGITFKSMIGHLGNFIDDCVERKIKYKKEKNECGKTVAKRDMNSQYGKFGSSYERIIYNYVLDEKSNLFKHERKYENENEYDYEEKRKYYKPYASFTTSYGRCRLIKVIMEIEEKYGSENFLYCDTDSIYTTLTIEELKTLHIKIDGDELGAWDIEKEFYNFKCIGAKKYILYGKDNGESDKKIGLIQHCAGLPNDEQLKLNFFNFNLGEKFMKKQKTKVYGGYRLIEREFTLKDFTLMI